MSNHEGGNDMKRAIALLAAIAAVYLIIGVKQTYYPTGLGGGLLGEGWSNQEE